jgi:hypothetical protein
MSWLLMSLVLSSIFLFVAVFVARRFGNGPACLLAITVTVVSIVFMAPAFTIHCFLTFVFSLGCLTGRTQPREFVICSVVAMVLSYGFFSLQAVDEMRNLEALRVEFPVESLEDRLAYESTEASTETTPVDYNISEDVETRLQQLEEEREYRGGMRHRMLLVLHESNVHDFAIARGFGVSRMGSVRRGWIELPESEPIPLPSPIIDEPYEPDLGTAPPLAADFHNEAPSPSRDSLTSIHNFGLRDFLDPETMGYVKERRQVAGFQSHQFRQEPNFESADWQVTRLELISMLRHETPVAYVSANLPSMEELKDSPTRPLTSFERASIESLRREKDVEISEDLNRIFMVGSIRAAKDCLDCHSVRRGELLGAFSYELQRVKPVSKPKDDDAQVKLHGGPDVRLIGSVVR